MLEALKVLSQKANWMLSLHNCGATEPQQRGKEVVGAPAIDALVDAMQSHPHFACTDLLGNSATPDMGEQKSCQKGNFQFERQQAVPPGMQKTTFNSMSLRADKGAWNSANLSSNKLPCRSTVSEFMRACKANNTTGNALLFMSSMFPKKLVEYSLTICASHTAANKKKPTVDSVQPVCVFALHSLRLQWQMQDHEIATGIGIQFSQMSVELTGGCHW